MLFNLKNNLLEFIGITDKFEITFQYRTIQRFCPADHPH